ncbi:hypothetical protein LPJ64_003548, partial [Coemansia asiatica]
QFVAAIADTTLCVQQPDLEHCITLEETGISILAVLIFFLAATVLAELARLSLCLFVRIFFYSVTFVIFGAVATMRMAAVGICKLVLLFINSALWLVAQYARRRGMTQPDKSRRIAIDKLLPKHATGVENRKAAVGNESAMVIMLRAPAALAKAVEAEVESVAPSVSSAASEPEKLVDEQN